MTRKKAVANSKQTMNSSNTRSQEISLNTITSNNCTSMNQTSINTSTSTSTSASNTNTNTSTSNNNKSDSVYYKNITVPNFRDVGLFIGKYEKLKPGILLRSADPCLAHSSLEIGNPKTVVNLRPREDIFIFPADHIKQIHCPTDDTIDVYDTKHKATKTWLCDVLGQISQLEPSNFPILIHCIRGKDRTGFLVAVILMLIGVDNEDILHDFAESFKTFGKRPVDFYSEQLMLALSYINKITPEKYFRDIPLQKIRTLFQP